MATAKVRNEYGRMLCHGHRCDLLQAYADYQSEDHFFLLLIVDKGIPSRALQYLKGEGNR